MTSETINNNKRDEGGSNPTISEMIAELQRAQSESIQENQSESENSIDDDLGGEGLKGGEDGRWSEPPLGLNLDPITEEQIEAVDNDGSSKSEEGGYRGERTGNNNGGYRGGETESSPPKFNADGYNKIQRAKQDGTLNEFASVLPPPTERAKILSPEARVNNSDTWARYVYRAAYNIPDNQPLGQEFLDFRCSLRLPTRLKKKQAEIAVPLSRTPYDLAEQKSQKSAEFARIMERDRLDSVSYNQAIGIANWFHSNGMSSEKYQICLEDIERYRD